jgi:hypothetical protein
MSDGLNWERLGIFCLKLVEKKGTIQKEGRSQRDHHDHANDTFCGDRTWVLIETQRTEDLRPHKIEAAADQRDRDGVAEQGLSGFLCVVGMMERKEFPHGPTQRASDP